MVVPYRRPLKGVNAADGQWGQYQHTQFREETPVASGLHCLLQPLHKKTQP